MTFEIKTFYYFIEEDRSAQVSSNLSRQYNLSEKQSLLINILVNYISHIVCTKQLQLLNQFKNQK